jgi:hypothetical protein
VEALLPKRPRDVEVDVHSHQVHELEGAHPEPAADPHDAVDLVVASDALTQQAKRLERERSRHPVGDESDPVPGADRNSPQGSRDLGREGERLLRGLIPGDDLDQPHHRRRVEEVHPADPLRAIRAGGDRGDREGRRVGRQDRPWPADGGESREQAALELEVLGRRLDHELAAG